MSHDLEHTLALLTRTPAVLDALLRDLPVAWTAHNEGGETWSVTEVLGHLVYGEHADWLPRVKQILSTGTSQPFDPFDRLGHLTASKEKSLDQLLDEFTAIRSENLAELSVLQLTPEQLDFRGVHPTFGEVTLSQLLATWSVHDLTHLTQISRIMAHQYRDAVGPWQQFLGVLHHKVR